MQKILFPLFILINMESFSQAFSTKLALKRDDSHFDVQLRKGNRFTAGFINNVSATVIRDVKKKFENATSIRWFVNDNTVTGYFDNDNEKITVLYQSNGYCIATWKNYEGNKLDPKVVDVLNGELGTRFTIYLVTELIRDTDTIYTISLQDQEYWCSIQIFKNNDEGLLKITDKQLLRKV